ncbi:MAG: SIR2 family protein [Planctomycetes bacterium]|nr:SIR2 family protein [Planctomycetota bacterium]
MEEIKDLRRCLFNLIIQEFKISLEAIEPKIYEKFIVKVKLIDYSIISTNYDILIDNALTKAIGLNYGAKVRTTITGEFKISGLRRPGFYDVGISVNESDKLLLKIHGSLNWLYCPKCDEVDITVYEKGAERTLDGSYYCFDKKCTCRYEPLLITPTMFKNYENRFIKETWDYAEKELTNAENIVFVGYALKYEDYQIRCLLMNALLNKIENYKKVIVIEKKPENNKEKKYIDNVKNKYQELYGDIVEFRPIGFTEYINNL